MPRSPASRALAPKVRTKKRPGALILLAVVALGIFALDQISKYLVVSRLTEGDIVRVLGDVLQMHFVRNPGAAFSMAAGMTWIFSIIAVAVVVLIVWFAGRIRSLAWSVVFGLLLGGVLGNLTDRLLREPSFGLGHVIDFISTPWLIPAIYNVADMAIVSSMIIFMYLTIRGIGLDGRRTDGSDSSESTPTQIAP
ncbi:signal peptidase II [Cryobacterium sinapicolor]|uniref:Lipoprotein signal peptidase n=1 Tax=Cryobacterium sinapicolor TaxID=1259236 RepID=A0ABY2IVK2_9MICO|nr:signal peptidase II [Cryobacterium sp. TMT3-29-2]TFC95534.1 signal peptidase II [Cryobacterium sinapicolor]